MRGLASQYNYYLQKKLTRLASTRMVLFHQMLTGCLASTGTNMVETVLYCKTVDDSNVTCNKL